MPAPRGTALVLGVLAATAGCYATTPHRAEVAGPGSPPACLAVVEDVFARSGLVAMMPPPGQVNFFAARTGGLQLASRTAYAGFSVVVTDPVGGAAPSGCRILVEAIERDSTCGGDVPLECEHPILILPPPNPERAPMCPALASNCPMVSSRSAETDAAVDELAKRLREALGPGAGVK